MLVLLLRKNADLFIKNNPNFPVKIFLSAPKNIKGAESQNKNTARQV